MRPQCLTLFCDVVVVDGEDLSRYDELGRRQLDDRADSEALEQLEWELATQEGRLTGEEGGEGRGRRGGSPVRREGRGGSPVRREGRGGAGGEAHR